MKAHVRCLSVSVKDGFKQSVDLCYLNYFSYILTWIFSFLYEQKFLALE